MTVTMSKEIFIFEVLIDFDLRGLHINEFILENYTTTHNGKNLVEKKVKLKYLLSSIYSTHYHNRS